MTFSLVQFVPVASEEFDRFLFNEQTDAGGSEFVFDPEPEPGYEFDPVDQALIADPANGQPLPIPYLVSLHYKLVEELPTGGTQIVGGTVKITATRTRDVLFTAHYKGLFKTGLDEAKRQYARQLFASYDPAAWPDINEYVKQNLNGELEEDDFILTTKVVCTLGPNPPTIDPDPEPDPGLPLNDTIYNSTVGVEKWEYAHGGWEPNNMHGPIAIGEHLESSRIFYKFVGEYLQERGAAEPNDPAYVIPTDTPDEPAPQYEGLIHDAIKEAVGVKCGNMLRRDYKLATVSSWPEFKVEIVSKNIRIGCSTITIWYPKVYTRTTRLVAYCYISVPEKIWHTLGAIIEACAVRAALEAAVVGVILGNPAAAAASFEALFKRCIAEEAYNCLAPGLYINKERSNWDPV